MNRLKDLRDGAKTNESDAFSVNIIIGNTFSTTCELLFSTAGISHPILFSFTPTTSRSP